MLWWLFLYFLCNKVLNSNNNNDDKSIFIAKVPWHMLKTPHNGFVCSKSKLWKVLCNSYCLMHRTVAFDFHQALGIRDLWLTASLCLSAHVKPPTGYTEFCWTHQLLLQTMSNKVIETTATHCQYFLQNWPVWSQKLSDRLKELDYI